MIETYRLGSERDAKTTVCSLSRPKRNLAAQLASIKMAHASSATLIEGEIRRGKKQPFCRDKVATSYKRPDAKCDSYVITKKKGH